MTLTVRALQTADAHAYKYARLLALKTDPSAFTSAYEPTSMLADQFFEDRASFKPDNFLFGAFDSKLSPPSNSV